MFQWILNGKVDGVAVVHMALGWLIYRKVPAWLAHRMVSAWLARRMAPAWLAHQMAPAWRALLATRPFTEEVVERDLALFRRFIQSQIQHPVQEPLYRPTADFEAILRQDFVRNIVYIIPNRTIGAFIGHHCSEKGDNIVSLVLGSTFVIDSSVCFRPLFLTLHVSQQLPQEHSTSNSNYTLCVVAITLPLNWMLMFCCIL